MPHPLGPHLSEKACSTPRGMKASRCASADMLPPTEADGPCFLLPRSIVAALKSFAWSLQRGHRVLGYSTPRVSNQLLQCPHVQKRFVVLTRVWP